MRYLFSIALFAVFLAGGAAQAQNLDFQDDYSHIPEDIQDYYDIQNRRYAYDEDHQEYRSALDERRSLYHAKRQDAVEEYFNGPGGSAVEQSLDGNRVSDGGETGGEEMGPFPEPLPMPPLEEQDE